MNFFSRIHYNKSTRSWWSRWAHPRNFAFHTPSHSLKPLALRSKRQWFETLLPTRDPPPPHSLTELLSTSLGDFPLFVACFAHFQERFPHFFYPDLHFSDLSDISIEHTRFQVMVDTDIEDRPVSNGLDWDKLFKMAEDLDLDEVVRGPIENALVHLWVIFSMFVLIQATPLSQFTCFFFSS